MTCRMVYRMFSWISKFVSCLLCTLKPKKNPYNFFQKNLLFPAVYKQHELLVIHGCSGGLCVGMLPVLAGAVECAKV